MALIPITNDLDPFFQEGEFAQTATYNGITEIMVILTDFDNPMIGGTVGLAGHEPFFICQLADIPDVEEGDTLAIGINTWIVREVMPDNTGIVRLKVEADNGGGAAGGPC